MDTTPDSHGSLGGFLGTLEQIIAFVGCQPALVLCLTAQGRRQPCQIGRRIGVDHHNRLAIIHPLLEHGHCLFVQAGFGQLDPFSQQDLGLGLAIRPFAIDLLREDVFRYLASGGHHPNVKTNAGCLFVAQLQPRFVHALGDFDGAVHVAQAV